MLLLNLSRATMSTNMIIAIYSTLSDKCSIPHIQYFDKELLISFSRSILLHSLICNPLQENMREPFGRLQLLLSFQVFRTSIHQHLRIRQMNTGKKWSMQPRVKEFAFMCDETIPLTSVSSMSLTTSTSRPNAVISPKNSPTAVTNTQ